MLKTYILFRIFHDAEQYLSTYSMSRRVASGTIVITLKDV